MPRFGFFFGLLGLGAELSGFWLRRSAALGDLVHESTRTHLRLGRPGRRLAGDYTVALLSGNGWRRHQNCPTPLDQRRL